MHLSIIRAVSMRISKKREEATARWMLLLLCAASLYMCVSGAETKNDEYTIGKQNKKRSIDAKIDSFYRRRGRSKTGSEWVGGIIEEINNRVRNRGIDMWSGWEERCLYECSEWRNAPITALQASAPTTEIEEIEEEDCSTALTPEGVSERCVAAVRWRRMKQMRWAQRRKNEGVLTHVSCWCGCIVRLTSDAKDPNSSREKPGVLLEDAVSASELCIWVAAGGVRESRRNTYFDRRTARVSSDMRMNSRERCHRRAVVGSGWSVVCSMKKTDSANSAVVIVCDKWSEEDDFLIVYTPFENSTHRHEGENIKNLREKEREVILRPSSTAGFLNPDANYFFASIKDTCGVFCTHTLWRWHMMWG